MSDPLKRRAFLKTGLGTTALAVAGAGLQSESAAGKSIPMREIHTDIAVIGGGLGGCAAALAALRQGMKVVLTEETDWLGGQMTSQAVPSDEHPWIEMVGNRSFLDFRSRIRDFYRRNFPLTAQAKGDPLLNPGLGGVSPICCEPRSAVAALEEMLAPYRSRGLLQVFHNHKPVRAEVEADAIKAVDLEDRRDGGTVTLSADLFLDATETGNLLPLASVEHVTGAESQKETGEPHAPSAAKPGNMQAVTWCFPMEYCYGEDHIIDRPEQYDAWQKFVPNLIPAWTGRLLSRRDIHPVTLEPRDHHFDPIREGKNEIWGLWRYRRIRYAGHYQKDSSGNDITLVNWPMNDYFLGNIFDGTEEENQKHLEGARQQSLSWLYWLQTEAPRDDGGTGWPGLKMRPDIVGTEDGLAKHPYIRESRRIKAMFTVLEQHVGTEARMAETGAPREEVKSASFADSIGLGSYRIDLHPSTGGDNYIDISSLPFEIPLGALIPIRMKNLLAACKNIGTTHITNGCYRLHPVEWNIGEAAGLLAAWVKNKNQTPHQVREDEKILHDFQKHVRDQGVPIRWPRFSPR